MIVMPEWTELADKRGLDPLGMQNSGIALYQRLLPGISNVTLRMRYYGFYCWLSDAYAHHEGSTDRRDWQRWVRRGEALIALISAAAGGESGVGGIEWADETLALDEPAIDFAEAAATGDGARRYLRQSMGVFGGAYYTQMVEMGLFVLGVHGVPKASIPLGVPLAQQFRETIGSDAEELLVAKIKSAHVTRDELSALAVAAPSRIPDSSSERVEYERALFRYGELATEKDESRRRSLILLLLVTDRLGRRPTPDEVRWHLFESFADEWPIVVRDQRLRWEAYHTQDSLQIAAAGLLDFAASLMGELPDGCTLEELGDEAERRMRRACALDSDWMTFRERFGSGETDFRGWHAKVSGRRFQADERAADAVHLLAAIDRRVEMRSDLADEIARSFASHGHGRSIRSELIWLRDHETEPASRLIAEYITSRVVRRHSWVAMQKLRRQRDYTFLFEAHDGRYVRRKSYQPVATTPRLAPAIQFLADIGLLTTDGLTKRGRAIVQAIQ